MLQSPSFPKTPVPTVSIADVLQLKQMQRFDLMAIVTKVIEERKSGAGMCILDVRLVDGSKENDSSTAEYASLPLTLFFCDTTALNAFKKCVGQTPGPDNTEHAVHRRRSTERQNQRMLQQRLLQSTCWHVRRIDDCFQFPLQR